MKAGVWLAAEVGISIAAGPVGWAVRGALIFHSFDQAQQMVRQAMGDTDADTMTTNVLARALQIPTGASYEDFRGVAILGEGVIFILVDWKPAGRAIANTTNRLESALDSVKGWKKTKSAINAADDIAPNRSVLIKDRKWDYFFGRGSSNPHNHARSLQNLKDLETLGFTDTPAGREGLNRLFEIGRHLPESATHTTKYGVTITRTVPAGTGGAIDVKYFYPGGDVTAIPEVSRIIPKVFK